MSENTVIKFLESYFYAARFGKNHLGMGDIRLTIGEQDDLIEAVANILNVNDTNV